VILESFIGVQRHLLGASLSAAILAAPAQFEGDRVPDRTTYHRDKEFLDAMTAQQLLMLAIRSVIAGEQLTVEAPHASNTGLGWMTGWLRDHFNGIFGRGIPMLQVVCSGR